MAKMALVEKMERAGSPKSWIAEVRQMLADHKTMEGRINELLAIVNNLAMERDQFRALTAEDDLEKLPTQQKPTGEAMEEA